VLVQPWGLQPEHDDDMCDTFVALSEATADGSVVLAKNSDREPNEAHEVVYAPAAEHAAGSTLRCTYITIPQAQHTNAVLLGKPYWIWGAEMGANSHGVVIGNEAVFTKVPHEKQPGLIGMDLLRLGLERADNAAEAVTVMTELLAQFGQAGNCGHTHTMRYHNSFIVADRTQAWVLETAGRQWAAQRVHGAASISNAITIASRFDRSSPGLVEHAVEKKWCSSPDEFDFGADYSDRIYTTFSDARVRQCRTSDALAAARGGLDVARAWAMLADHGERADGRPGWSPADNPVGGLFGQTVCAHAGFGPVRVSQTTGSWISTLPTDGSPDTHWVTGTSAPCLSLRKPVWFDALAAAGMPDVGPEPGRNHTPGSLWWDHEDLHRAVLRDYPRLRALIEADRQAVQDQIDARAAQAEHGAVKDRVACSAEAFATAAEAEARWLREVRAAAPTRRARSPYQLAWARFDKAAARA
jgi:secernin